MSLNGSNLFHDPAYLYGDGNAQYFDSIQVGGPIVLSDIGTEQNGSLATSISHENTYSIVSNVPDASHNFNFTVGGVSRFKIENSDIQVNAYGVMKTVTYPELSYLQNARQNIQTQIDALDPQQSNAYWGYAYSTTANQTFSATNTPQSALLYNIDASALGIQLADASGGGYQSLKVLYDGIYQIVAIFQVKHPNNNKTNLSAWFQKNGTNIGSSLKVFNVVGQSEYNCFQLEMTMTLAVNDRITTKCMVDDTGVYLAYTAATGSPAVPASMAYTLAISQISTNSAYYANMAADSANLAQQSAVDAENSNYYAMVSAASASDSAASAQTSKNLAATSATNALNYRNTALVYRNQAETFSIAASTSASAASASASQAGSYASAASDSKNAAASSADSAANSSGAASSSASSASSSASSASSSASSASSSASSAAASAAVSGVSAGLSAGGAASAGTSATAAAASAAAAAGSAGAASTSAGQAATSATNASNSSTQSGNSASEAKGYRDESKTYRDEAKGYADEAGGFSNRLTTVENKTQKITGTSTETLINGIVTLADPFSATTCAVFNSTSSTLNNALQVASDGKTYFGDFIVPVNNVIIDSVNNNTKFYNQVTVNGTDTTLYGKVKFNNSSVTMGDLTTATNNVVIDTNGYTTRFYDKFRIGQNSLITVTTIAGIDIPTITMNYSTGVITCSQIYGATFGPTTFFGQW